MRITQMNGVDISLFRFDYDLTFAAMFLDADAHVYSRYGGRDHLSADSRISIAGLKNTMRAVLARHRGRRGDAAPAPLRIKVTPEDLPAAPPALKGGERCIHCHQVYELQWASARRQGTFTREALWGYPLPENIGLSLDVDLGALIRAAAPGSAAHRAGMRAGDVLETVNGVPVFSQADVQWGLYHAPAEGRFPVQFRRHGQLRTVSVEVARGWRRTNNIWRASVRRQ